MTLSLSQQAPPGSCLLLRVGFPAAALHPAVVHVWQDFAQVCEGALCCRAGIHDPHACLRTARLSGKSGLHEVEKEGERVNVGQFRWWFGLLQQSGISMPVSRKCL